jgi:2-keto-4-pentenoate hydratase/2-oxohepta-3-ene-1,7-dioic acid hydratase in catechol pathway
MRLVSFGRAGSEKPGVVVEGGVLDLLRCDPSLPGSLRAILEQERLDAVRRLAVEPPAGAVLPLPEVRLGPPIPNPAKIICLGLNYADHAAEGKRPVPEAPLLFAKSPTAVNGLGDPILLPPGERVDIEAELAVVIGRRARRVHAEEANAVIAGYMCFNDVSGRAAQFADKQWFRGKSYDTFAPCGPWLVTPDEVPDPHALGIRSRLNDFVLQESHTSRLVFRIPQILEYITRGMTLLPGDIIATGTPDGVGVFRDPPIFVQDGDRVEVWIEGLGTLWNPARVEPAAGE